MVCFLMAASAAWPRSCETKLFSEWNIRPHCLQVSLSSLDASSALSSLGGTDGEDDEGLGGTLKVSAGVTFHLARSSTVSSTGSSSCQQC